MASTSAASAEARIEFSDGTGYSLALERITVRVLTALFGQPISFLTFDSKPLFPDAEGRFAGCVAGRTYFAEADPKAVKEKPKTDKKTSTEKWDEVEQRTRVLKVFRRFDTNKASERRDNRTKIRKFPSKLTFLPPTNLFKNQTGSLETSTCKSSAHWSWNSAVKSPQRIPAKFST